jgi:hypothetical protein
MSETAVQPETQSDDGLKEKELYVSIWAKAVDTQMHFNDMCVKSRQFGLAGVHPV